MDSKEVGYFVNVEYKICEDVVAPINDKDKAIGGFISQDIKDGDSMQIAIGSIPNSVVQYLAAKKNLGIHTELAGDGAIELVKKGIVNGTKKTIDTNILSTSIVFASQSSYDYVNLNKNVRVMRCSHSNAFNTLASQDNQVSINTSLEVDLTGQCCSESLGSKQFSGTGGQTDTAVGTQMAKCGKAFIALYSTANVKQADGTRKEVSKIVVQLKQGAAVSLHRNDVMYIATEYGVVNLKGLSIANRAKALISIAHPSFREELTAQAKQIGLIK